MSKQVTLRFNADSELAKVLRAAWLEDTPVTLMSSAGLTDIELTYVKYSDEEDHR